MASDELLSRIQTLIESARDAAGALYGWCQADELRCVISGASLIGSIELLCTVFDHPVVSSIPEASPATALGAYLAIATVGALHLATVFLRRTVGPRGLGNYWLGGILASALLGRYADQEGAVAGALAVGFSLGLTVAARFTARWLARRSAEAKPLQEYEGFELVELVDEDGVWCVVASTGELATPLLSLRDQHDAGHIGAIAGALLLTLALLAGLGLSAIRTQAEDRQREGVNTTAVAPIDDPTNDHLQTTGGGQPPVPSDCPSPTWGETLKDPAVRQAILDAATYLNLGCAGDVAQLSGNIVLQWNHEHTTALLYDWIHGRVALADPRLIEAIETRFGGFQPQLVGPDWFEWLERVPCRGLDVWAFTDRKVLPLAKAAMIRVAPTATTSATDYSLIDGSRFVWWVGEVRAGRTPVPEGHLAPTPPTVSMTFDGNPQSFDPAEPDGAEFPTIEELRDACGQPGDQAHN